MHTQKNQVLDIIKLIAAYMVVFIHVPFYGAVDVVVDAVARFAVPLFFFISGFFSYGISTEKTKKRITHILKLYFIATVIYTIKNVGVLLAQKDIQGLVAYFMNYTNVKTLIKLFVFNRAVASGLWHFLALLYVYIIFYFCIKFAVREKVLFVISFILLAAHLFLGEICSMFGIVVSPVLTRNFMLFGIPFFGIGLLVKKHLHKVIIPKSNNMIWLLLALGALLSVVSRVLFGLNELHIGSLFILAGMVMLAIKYADRKYSKTVIRLAACSTNMYIFHPLMNELLKVIYSWLGIQLKYSVLMQMLHPLVVCLLTTLLSLAINEIQSKVAQYKAKV